MLAGMTTIQSYFTSCLSFYVQSRHGLRKRLQNAARDTRNKKQKAKIQRTVTLSAFIQNIYIYIYTECNRRNGPDFGRVFLMLNYTEKPQNTYIQS